jgi:hypothetical protein
MIGIAAGFAQAVLALTALTISLPGIILTILTVFGIPVAILPLFVPILLLAISYLAGYVLASLSIAGDLPTTAFPLAAPFPTAVPVALPPRAGELFARGFLIGMTAAINAAIIALVPLIGTTLAAWVFTIGSLAIVRIVSINQIYQGFLGWSAWLFPMSYFATAIGAILFVINIPFAFAAGGPGAFRIDFTTGTIETAGGLSGITGFVGGFSLGNFNFVTPGLQGVFTASNVSSHEAGHSLNTAIFGGLVLWINAIDENIPPLRKLNLSYGELTAESHSQAMTPPLRNDFFARLWV